MKISKIIEILTPHAASELDLNCRQWSSNDQRYLALAVIGMELSIDEDGVVDGISFVVPEEED